MKKHHNPTKQGVDKQKINISSSPPYFQNILESLEKTLDSCSKGREQKGVKEAVSIC